jgi:O-6-methylguanine DNA methyltransferase
MTVARDPVLEDFVARAGREGLIDVSYAEVDSPFGPLLVAATERGLVRVAFDRETHEEVLGDLAGEISPRVLEDPARLDEARRQLDRYFDGELHRFSLPLDWQLTHGFRRKVLHATARVPYGSTSSYAEMAAEAGSPRAFRAAGSALAANPIPIVVPCHRIIRSGGDLGNYGGAETGDVIIATLMGAIATALVVGPIILYRRGSLPFLERLANRSGAWVGMPGWAALPLGIHGASLIIAVFGMYWDISIHIDEGRDPGPLANPAHYFILVGLLGVMAAGVLGMALPKRAIRSSVHIPGPGWDAPAGALLIAACGAFSLSAFPLDDVWHRIFGQDVTLWSPTHLMLITGASLSTFGGFALYREALEEGGEPAAIPERAGWVVAPLAGALLIGLNTFMAEFDFGVPQFRLDLHPIGLMMASGIALVAARVMIGPWGALATVGFFLIIRGGLTLIVGVAFGHTEPHFPLYIAEAVVVEVVALGFATEGGSVRSRSIPFGIAAGLGIGTIGLAAEWGWSHVWTVQEWPDSMFPEAAILALIMAVAAGTIGGFAGPTLTWRGKVREAVPYWGLAGAALVAVAVVLYALPISSGDGRTSASVRTSEVSPPPNREVDATVRLRPPDAADDARWLNVTSWQGGERSIVQPLERVGPGTYRTTEPIPVNGTWKSILRLHRDDEVLGMPVFLPRDTAIPAPEVPAPPTFTRGFQLDKKNLQREQKEGVSPSLSTGAYISVLLLTIGLLAILFWTLQRIYLRQGRPPPPAGPRPRRGLGRLAGGRGVS